jgi:hypothetical protein
MKYDYFLDQLEATGAVLNKQVTPLMYETYWNEFETWTDEQFAGALIRCKRELDFFPTIKQIRERFVVRRQLQQDQPNPAVGLLTVEENSDDKATSSLESTVDAMSDDDLQSLMESNGLSEQAARTTVRKFRRHPQGKLFRGFIKDLVSPNWNEINEPTFLCLQCRDRGTIEVYTPSTCRKANAETLRTSDLQTWMVACRCEAGQQFQYDGESHERNRCRKLMKFEPWMVAVEKITSEEMVDEIELHYKSRKQLQGVGDFDDWK